MVRYGIQNRKGDPESQTENLGREFEDQSQTKILVLPIFGILEIFSVFRDGLVFPNFIQIEIAIIHTKLN